MLSRSRRGADEVDVLVEPAAVSRFLFCCAKAVFCLDEPLYMYLALGKYRDDYYRHPLQNAVAVQKTGPERAQQGL